MIKVNLPDFDEQIDGAVINFWNYEEGDPIEVGENLVEVVAEDVTYTVPAPISGILSERYFEEGDEVEVGELLAVIDEE